jgi:hypothetical protein
MLAIESCIMSGSTFKKEKGSARARRRSVCDLYHLIKTLGRAECEKKWGTDEYEIGASLLIQARVK